MLFQVVLKKLNQLESMLQHERMRRSAIDNQVDHILRCLVYCVFEMSEFMRCVDMLPQCVDEGVRYIDVFLIYRWVHIFMCQVCECIRV